MKRVLLSLLLAASLPLPAIASAYETCDMDGSNCKQSDEICDMDGSNCNKINSPPREHKLKTFDERTFK